MSKKKNKKRKVSLGYLTKEGFRNVHANRHMSVASVAVLMACLIMIGSAFMVLVNVESIMSKIERENVVMVYLDLGTTPEQIKEVETQINTVPNVVGVVFKDRETAYQEAIKDLGAAATYFDEAENKLPDTFEVSVGDMTKFSETVSKLENLEHVDSIRHNKDIANMLVKIRSSISYVSIGIIAVLLVISLFIIANTIRITMFNRRLEINIMKSVGATNWFIRWPFIVEGMILGFISAVLSLGVVWGVYKLIEPTVSSVLGMVSKNFTVVPFTDYVLYIAAAFIIIGLFSGNLGSLISIQKYLKERGGVVDNDVE